MYFIVANDHDYFDDNYLAMATFTSVCSVLKAFNGLVKLEIAFVVFNM